MDETKVITDYRGLVVELAGALARQYKLRRFMDDLIAYGNEGLLEAARRYDPSRGATFATYAWYRVRGRMLDGCRSFGLVERHAADTLAASRATNDHLLDRLDAQPDLDDIAAQSLEDIAAGLDEMVADAAAIFLFFDESEADDEPDDEPSPEERAIQRRSYSRVRHHLAALQERHRVVLEMSFLEERTLDEIAARFDCSRSWASRMRAAAVEALRRAVTAEERGP